VPVLLGTAPKLDTYAGSLRASGKYVYVANWDCGCAVFDVSDPASPFLSGSYGGYGDPDYIVARDIAVGGSYVCVVDSEKRLHILHVVEGAWPVLSVSRDTLYFRSLLSPGMWTSPQTLLVSNTGFGTLQWTATADEPWIVVNPASGTEDGFLSVGVAPAGLAAGSYAGTVTIIDPNATGSPKTITVYLTVEASAEGSPPFGYFDTPLDGTTGVTGAIPVTGWALDDIEVMSVKIFRDQDPSDPQGAIGLNGLVYIGEAVFVEGARPDVEMSGDGQRRPFNYRAGWGYMLLTNMLPGQGNGAFTIYAFAYDLETHATLLGTKTISCDNAHAVKPFGTIDTPAQGGGASGPSYANFGWVLTPLPNEIPKDGSTIGVWIDSLLVGNAVYDLYRKDVAENFPGLNNSNGPVGYYYVDTTEYAAGVHTIWWTAEDGAGNTDGIGSRYFTIANAGSFAPVPLRTQRRTAGAFSTLEEIIGFPLAPTPLHERRGFRFSAPPEMLEASQNGTYQIALEEVELMTLYLDPDRVDDDHPVSLPYRPGLGPATDAAQIKARRLEPLETAITPPGRWRQRYSGYMIVGGELRPLPIGSTLDPESGTFAWLPGPGFLGTYDLVFVRESAAGVTTRIPVRITVKPKS
jgi:hypothetical protein